MTRASYYDRFFVACAGALTGAWLMGGPRGELALALLALVIWICRQVDWLAKGASE